MTSALLIIDVQNAILEGEAPPERRQVMDLALNKTVARLGTLQDKARARGVPVIVVQHDDPPGSRLAIGTPGWELRPEIAPKIGEVLVSKRACDSFFDTDLDQRLRERSVGHVVIGGCMTQFCVDTTVRRAVSLGYDVTLIADGHMTADRGALTFEQIISHHNMTLDGFDAGDRVVSVRQSGEIHF
jgi:nicotinamidase-related amidase